METRIIKAVFGASKSIVAPKRYKHDFGQEIEFVGIDLPDVFEAHFSNSKSGQAKKQIGQGNVVTVPDEYFASGADIFCWVMVHDEATDGRTMYTVRIPVMERPEPINAEPTPVQQDVIEQAIAALNAAADQTARDVESADASAQSASDSADRAETARDTAEGYASDAQTSASNASTSAQSAAQSATASANSASQAQQIKTDVEGMVDEAQSAAGASAQSALESAQSAYQASTSASSASQSADTASTKASEASASAQTASAKATEASEYASTASQKASESSQSATQASGYATAAGQAKTAAESAQTAAEGSAQTALTAAQTAATKAAEAAESARTLTIDPTLTQSGQAADAKVVGDDIAQLKSDLSYLLNSYHDISFTADSYVNYTNGNVVGNLSGASASSAVTVFEGLNLVLKNYSTTSASDVRGLAFYDKDDVYISGLQLTGADVSVTVPQYAVTMKFTVSTAKVATYNLLVDLTPLTESYYPTLADVALLKSNAEILSVQYTSGGYVNNVAKNITALANFAYSDLITLYKGQGIQVQEGVSSTTTVVDELSRWDANGNYIESLHAYQTKYVKENTSVYYATKDIEYVRVCCFTLKGWNPLVVRYNNNTDRINALQNNLSDDLLPSISMFEKVGFCGDSYVKGQLFSASGVVVGDRPNLSWGKNIARMYGITGDIYASSGADTNTFQSRSNCLPALLASQNPCGLYVFCLGINDANYVTLGSIEDITDYEDWHDYPNTFYGNYGKIIEQIMAYSPASKIILMTPYHPSFIERYETPLTEISEYYGIAMIDTKDSELCTDSNFTNMLVGGHPTSVLHSVMGRDIANLISKCLQSNYTYFKTYYGLS